MPDNVTVHGDPERRVYIAFGLGELGWGDVINFGIIDKVKALQKEGISNRLTRGTRYVPKPSALKRSKAESRKQMADKWRLRHRQIRHSQI